MRRFMSALVTPGALPNRLVRGALAAAAIATTAISARELLETYPRAVDLEIPLRATERWLHGGLPYLASSFQATSGPDQPFLYPPFLLPLVAPLIGLPRLLVVAGWAVVCLWAAVWACHRLGMPAWWLPAVLAWPPFAEPLLGLNVQVVLFALFIALFWHRTEAWGRPRDRDPGRRPFADGLLAVAIAVLKTSQVQAWVYLLRRRPAAALLGLGVTAALVLATVPFTGIGAWGAWLAQVRHAAQPDAIGGISLLDLLPLPLSLLVAVASVALVFAVPRERAGVWIGLLLVIGSPSLHYFGLLFALPAMLLVRREIGLAAAFSIALYTTEGAWAGVALLSGALLMAAWIPALLEPAPPLRVASGLP